ncbi:MAG TPA: AmmeMemoRadiSam system protein A [Gemmatimonadales bacterium]|nr:AmmeMemoRadiSam system protein A [Gemmatimonadales bacterium]
MSSSTAPTPSGGESRTIGAVELPPAARRELLAFARACLEADLVGAVPPPPPDDGRLAEPRGAFVSLYAGAELRGCIGHLAADRPLAEVVARMAVAAARRDPRFPPVTADELADLRIEISVLSQPLRLEPPDPARIVIGRHGVMVRRGRALGVLLPQVGPAHRWDARALLAATCRKAGLSADAWREPETQVFVFEAHVIAEAEA